MASLHNVYVVLILAVISLATDASNRKFCIRSVVSESQEEYRECEILATAFTTKEKDTFQRTMCKDHVKNIKGDYSYFKIRHGVLEDRQSYKQLCQESTNPLLAWVPWKMVRDSIAQGLDKKKRNFYIAKATNQENSKTDLCYFSQTALLSDDKFGCTLMIFEDIHFGSDSDINVLVEVLPILYEIRNVAYEPWTNVTHNYKTALGKGILKNPSNEEKTIYSSIDYGFVEKIKLDTKDFVNGSLEKLPLAFDHKNNVIDLENGSGSIEIRKKYYFGRPMSPRTTLKVDLIGQWSEHRREFRADLYESYGHGFSHYKQPVELTKISFIVISNIEPVYENPELIGMSERNKELVRYTQGGLGENITTVNRTTTEDTWNQPYPGFYPFFIVGCVLLSTVVFLAVGKMLIILLREGGDKSSSVNY